MKKQTLGRLVLLILLLFPLLVWGGNYLHKRYRRYVCGQNLKRLGTAQTVYANDYDDEYVLQGQPPNWKNPGDNTVYAIEYVDANGLKKVVVIDPNEAMMF